MEKQVHLLSPPHLTLGTTLGEGWEKARAFPLKWFLSDGMIKCTILLSHSLLSVEKREKMPRVQGLR